MNRIRRSLLFVPGNNPGMLQSCGVFDADSVILDLEDAVPPGEKDAARLLVAEALSCVDFYNSEKVVRINPLDFGGREDIRCIVPCQPDCLMVPKVQTESDIKSVVEMIVSSEVKDQKTVCLIALIETPLGLAEAYKIATVDSRVKALAFGAEDYTASIGAIRTKEGREILASRCMLVNAASAAGVEIFDTPFTDVNDKKGLEEDASLAKNLGFKGKMAINPRQIDVIHSIFNPGPQEICWAEKIIDASRKAKDQGAGVVAVDGKMVDAPIVARAERVLRLAKLLGLWQGPSSGGDEDAQD